MKAQKYVMMSLTHDHLKKETNINKSRTSTSIESLILNTMRPEQAKRWLGVCHATATKS